MKILALGDVTGRPGTDYLSKKLRSFRQENGIDFTVVNAENSAAGNGIDRDSAEALLSAGADVLTTGNHVFRINSFGSYLDDARCIVRPANFPAECPGQGYCISDTTFGRVLVANVQGVVYMEPLSDPFATVEAILKRAEGSYDLALLDIHAEATSEKAALARYFDGRFAAVFGTHTHVQTADARILPRGTGFITDLGMCGPDDSILGVRCDRVIEKMRLHMPRKFEYAEGKVTATGAIFDIRDGKTVNVTAVRF